MFFEAIYEKSEEKYTQYFTQVMRVDLDLAGT